MRSRKSIFYRGIVFVMGIMALTFFSFIKVHAACEVSFNDGNQYLTLGGDQSKWSDSGLKGNSECTSPVTVESITVNGVSEEGTTFVPTLRASGHYTVGYKYSSGETNGTIYRYVRILNSSLNTSDNYTLGTFDLEGASSVIDSFHVSDNYYANFVVVGNKTYVVVKDVLGRDVANGEVELKQSGAEFVAVKVLEGENNVYYVIGNNASKQGIVVTVAITVAEKRASIAQSDSFSKAEVVYNSGFLYNSLVYLVGQSKDGYPIIESYTTPNTNNLIYTHSVKGAYNGVVVVNGVIYAVGYTRETTSTAFGLYTYYTIANEETYSDAVLKDKDTKENAPNTIYNDIVNQGDQNIIVGSSAANNIYANGALSATNNGQGYSDAIILKVSLDGTAVSGAYMLGGAVDDTFLSIKLISGTTYAVVGTTNNGIASLVYRLETNNFEATLDDATSGKSEYKINGIASWSYGYIYYGEITNSSNPILGVYYPLEISENKDALFVSLDNRSFENYDSLNLIVKGEYKHCDYKITYAGSLYGDTACEDNDGSTINTTTEGTGETLTYKIDASTGVMIYIYRRVNITQAPVPSDLTNGNTGILRWYVYNRSYNYTDSTATRLETKDFDYRFSGSVHNSETIEDMIEYYFKNGNTNGYTLSYVTSKTETDKTFTKSDQTNAAFASIEMAKKYAYYQEFSRVVRVDGSNRVDALGAYRYNGVSDQVVDGRAFFIYYIDFRGNNSSDLVANCTVGENLITNCSNKGGYAFASLNEIKNVIERFLKYNNYFISTRNTIYNGSVPESEIATYKQTLTTKEYLKNTGFNNTNTNLKFNVAKEDGTLIYSGENANVYFGGSISGTRYTYPGVGTVEVSEYMGNDSETKYYQSASKNQVFFNKDACYKVYYSYGERNGNARIFCLDNTAPIIVYKKDSSDTTTTQAATSSLGTRPSSPLPIESDFSIVDLIDLDDYSFIYVNGNRYPLQCENNGQTSDTCLEEVNTYIKQTFRFDKNDPNRIWSIEFSDRLLNTNTFYFTIGTSQPTITTEDLGDEEGFTLVIDFYDTNSIEDIALQVSQQICSGDLSNNCYTPDARDENAITNARSQFNEALKNYIYAISYRDNNRQDEAVLNIVASEGVYTINGIKYVIEDGYFVEVEGYEESYGVEDDNTFTYNENKYYYDSINSSIKAMKLDGDRYVEDIDVPAIPIVDNKFRFVEDGKEYQVVNEEGTITIEVLPQSYEIYNDNLLTLNDIIYTIDFQNETLSYSNPDISVLKHIELEFSRTRSVAGILSGGVDIPKTTRVSNERGEELNDDKTGLPAYQITEGESVHFNLVDGVYTFTISQKFRPYTIEAEGRINVRPLELKLGISKENVNLEVERSPFVYEDELSGIVPEHTLLLEKVTNSNYQYPLNVSDVPASGLGSYSNTNFVNRTMYVSFTIEGTGVFTIDVYKNKNTYGLPSVENSTLCKEIIIYGNSYESSPIDDDNRGCSESQVIAFNETNSHGGELEELGITHIFTDNGSFAFTGNNVFYKISLANYRYDDDSGQYIRTIQTTRTFYIDNDSPIKDAGKGKTITPYIYNESGEVHGVTFNQDENVYRLSSAVGATTNVGFKVSWYQSGSEDDNRENKLLLIKILGQSVPLTCNLYRLVSDSERYENGCQEFIDLEESYSRGLTGAEEFMVVFSKTGTYEIAFVDASGNEVTYYFVIDKSAPVATLTDANMDLNGGSINLSWQMLSDSDEGVNYYITRYVKNPTFTIALEDLSAVSRFCYYFDYGQMSHTESCVDGTEQTYMIRMSDYRVDDQSIDEYFAQNNLDQNVTLVVWAIDSLNNNADGANVTKINFWIDYRKPDINNVEKENVNDNLLGSEEIDSAGMREKTITIISDNYSGKEFKCEEAGFSFNDSRYDNTVSPYKFVIHCQDSHEIGGRYPSDYQFDNSMYMRFYEWTGSEKGELFNFGLPSTDGGARWIYITVVDSVGNESDKYEVVPIIVLDSINPHVTQAQRENLNGDGTFVDLAAVEYTYPGGSRSQVYLANKTIRLTFNEPLAGISSCQTTVGNKSTTLSSGECQEYTSETRYQYSQLKQVLDFTSSQDNTYKVFVIKVLDFAGLESDEIVVVIDKINPTVNFNAEGGNDDIIEYRTSSKAYDENYSSGGYLDHIYHSDDQEAGVTVNVKYYRYAPSVTYNNYQRSGNVYSKVDNFTNRGNKVYYILVKTSAATNKQCVAYQDNRTRDYCFVEDRQGLYYFDSLLEDNEHSIWESVEKIDSSKVGVYRITYQVVDYAGNLSEIIYKKVFVNDSINPDIDIYDRAGENKLFGNVTSDNPDDFEGKLNKVVSFRGIDSAVDSETRLVLYSCDVDSYSKGNCDIDVDLYLLPGNNSLRKSTSTSNVFEIANLAEGVYKMFVYDIGSYLSMEATDILLNAETEGEKVYSLTYNSAYFYFAIRIGEINAVYTVYGNKYTNSYQSGSANIHYEYSDTNYYTITNGTISDVYLVRYNSDDGSYVDISGTNAVGYGGSQVEFNRSGKTVTVIYKDNRGREIYKVVYEEYEINEDQKLMLHETYHNIDVEGKTIEVCKIINGNNQCNDLPVVYKVVSVKATIYEDGTYQVRMIDRYGNLSQAVETYVVDNTPYTVNKENNKATGVNFWYSVPSSVVTPSNANYFARLVDVSNSSDINVLDEVYRGNFNSEFFYAFASRADAITYITTLYRNEITSQLAQTGAFTFYNIKGEIVQAYSNSDGVSKIMSEITTSLQRMIYRTYTQNRNFSDSEIAQVAYTSSSISSSMYKYVYLLVTKNFTPDGRVTRNYTLVGENQTCRASENQECVKVELKIVSSIDTSIQLAIDSSLNNIICRVRGTGGASELTGTACNFSTVTSGATYVFIDTDVSKYHENIVYYGITAYAESGEIEYGEIGDYIPLEEFKRYSKETNGYVETDGGEYIWINSKFVLVSSLLNTNLYTKSCSFKSDTKNDCIFVSYLSRYTSQMVSGRQVYLPSSTGSYYYNYYDGSYYEKEEVMSELNVDSTYSDDGNRCEGSNCNNVPIKINNEKVNATLIAAVVKQTNKKVYIELFNQDTDSKLFEINEIKTDDKYSEVYSYVTLVINGSYYNINQFIVISNDGMSYRCILDINLETAYNIIVIDRAGNQLHISVSHSSVIPTITYTKQTDETTSNVTIDIETDSAVATFSKNNIKVYKYNANNFEVFSNNTCLVYLQDLDDNATTKQVSLEFRYNAYYNCSGIYKIEVADNHGNSNYKIFVFNPYDTNSSFVIEEGSTYYEYEENGIYGVVVNGTVKVEVDSSINYVVIKRYDPYTNLDLQEPTGNVTIKDFSSNTSIGTCQITITRLTGTNYAIYISGGLDHSCDGIYTVDLVNRFSEEVLKSEFSDVEGANKELITYQVKYGEAQTIEIDTMAPPSELRESNDQYFTIHVDEVENDEDTKTLITNKTISYKNKYITVAWGKYEEYSLTYLKYKINEEDDVWQYQRDNVTYSKDYTASYTFMITSPGVYNCQFMFVDAVGNENAEAIFTIIITIEAPNVGFYEVGEVVEGVITPGRKYEQGERIGDSAVLKCLEPSGSSYTTKNCTMADYNYIMKVNGTEYSNFYDDLELADIISRESMWLRGSAAQYADELIINLIVSIIGKPDIKTELTIIIDKKAPEITLDGVVVGTTYTGGITIIISQEDDSNNAVIYRCDVIEDDICKVYDAQGTLVNGRKEFDVIPAGTPTYTISNAYSGYFMVVAQDDLGNTSSKWFSLDNTAPVIQVTTENATIAPNMYTNARAVYVSVFDLLSSQGATFTIEFTPLNSSDSSEIVYNPSLGLTLEGKYVLTPRDGVNIEGRSITFYIYRQAPKYTITTNNGEEDTHLVNSEASLSWSVEDNELIAPIVSVTMDGKMYEATYNSGVSKYIGTVIRDIGEHFFVITDAAGNRSVIMVTINNTNKVCINGVEVEVKMQAYYNVDNLRIGGEKGVNYEVDDVIIFALPSQANGGGCTTPDLLNYRTLDSENSNYLITNERNANTFNNTQTGIDFVANGFISQSAIEEVKNVGGTVVVFVVTKSVANRDLGYHVGTNFFMEDPIGWAIIFISGALMVWPACRIFIKKKVRVI